jgi:hypothetical protein
MNRGQTFAKKQRGRLSEGVLVLHDNSRPHTTLNTRETLPEPKFEVLNQPTCSQTLHLRISISLGL